MSQASYYTDDNFPTEVMQSLQPVLVDFWAPWCGPCRLVGPTIEALAASAGDAYRVGKLNVDDHPQTAAAYGISSIPTVIVFQDGKPQRRLVGVHSEQAYREALTQAVEA